MKWKPPEVVGEGGPPRSCESGPDPGSCWQRSPPFGGRDRARGRHLIAMFACMYFAALRPAEAVNLHKDDCDLTAAGWGRIYLSRTTPEVGKRYTDSGELHDSKGLKHRPADEVRPVPIPPELVVILHWHLAEFGITPDGRLFRQVNGRVVSSSTYGQVWRAARLIALAPDQQASPLAARPYDLRHAAVFAVAQRGSPGADSRPSRRSFCRGIAAGLRRLHRRRRRDCQRPDQRCARLSRPVGHVRRCGFSSRAYPVTSRRRRPCVAYGCTPPVPQEPFARERSCWSDTVKAG